MGSGALRLSGLILGLAELGRCCCPASLSGWNCRLGSTVEMTHLLEAQTASRAPWPATATGLAVQSAATGPGEHGPLTPLSAYALQAPPFPNSS